MGMVAAVMFRGRARVRWLLGAATGAVVFLVVYVSLMGYAGDRITAWLHPGRIPATAGYQILQSLYAIGSGGLFGLGLGKSRQKYLYLPFQYNDYIFAILCELGLVGALGIMTLFALLILRGYRIALECTGPVFLNVLSAGLVTLIAVQTLLNFGVVTNLLPSTGVALPSSLMAVLALAVNLGKWALFWQFQRPVPPQTAGTALRSARPTRRNQHECGIYLRRNGGTHQSRHCRGQYMERTPPGERSSLSAATTWKWSWCPRRAMSLWASPAPASAGG